MDRVDRRKRILYYNHTRLVSGGERMLLNMLAVLDRTKYEPLVACPVEGPGELDALLTQQGFQPIAAPLLAARFTANPAKLVRYLWSFAATIFGFRRTIRDAAPDVIHANSVRGGIVATLATIGWKTPVLWHVQDDLPRHPISTSIRLLAYLSRRTRPVSVSCATAKAFAGRLNFGTRAEVLYNAIDRRRFPRKTLPLDAEAQAFRDELGVTATDFLVVTVGMLNPRKGLLELIEAFALQPAGAHLAVVGAPIFNQDHLYEARLQERAKALALDKVIHLTGPRKDVPAILRAADLFVLNATIEPFGLMLLEAMSSGTPVIGAAVGGIPEIVEDGATGWLVPSPRAQRFKDDEALPNRLAVFFDDANVAKPLAEAAYTQVLPRFSMEVFTRNLHGIYASVTR